MTLLMSMSPAAFPGRDVVAVEHPVDRKRHMTILIDIRKVTLWMMHLCKFKQRAIKYGLLHFLQSIVYIPDNPQYSPPLYSRKMQAQGQGNW